MKGAKQYLSPFIEEVRKIAQGPYPAKSPGAIQGLRARGLQGKSLESFVLSNLAMGNDLAVPDFLLNPKPNTFYGDLTADQFEAARDAVASLMHVGRATESVLMDGRRYALQDMVDEANDRMAAVPTRDSGSRLNPERARDIQGVMHLMASGMRSVDASLVKMEQLFSELDNYEVQGRGPLLRLFDTLKGAQHAEYDRLETIAKRWLDLKSRVPDDWAKGLRDLFTVPELKDPSTGHVISMSRDELLGMALNVGNTGPTSNFEKLTKGFG
jgi:hypothetical protein